MEDARRLRGGECHDPMDVLEQASRCLEESGLAGGRQEVASVVMWMRGAADWTGDGHGTERENQKWCQREREVNRARTLGSESAVQSP